MKIGDRLRVNFLNLPQASVKPVKSLEELKKDEGYLYNVARKECIGYNNLFVAEVTEFPTTNEVAIRFYDEKMQELYEKLISLGKQKGLPLGTGVIEEVTGMDLIKLRLMKFQAENSRKGKDDVRETIEVEGNFVESESMEEPKF